MRRWLLVTALAVGCRPTASAEDEPRRARSDAVANAGGAPSEAPGDGERPRSPAEVPRAPTAEGSRDPARSLDPARSPDLPPTPGPDLLAAPASDSTSIGRCTAGRLEGSLALPLRAPGLVFHPGKDPGSRFGTVELVQGLVRAAAAVERAHPGVPLTVGDLARERGGEIPGHASHRSGRDVDVLFYLRRDDGAPFAPAKAIPLDPDGRGTDYGDLADPSDDVPVTLDAARTWSFVAALLADEAVAVQRIFVVEHLRTRLLEEARRVHAPAAVVQRFEEVTCQPSFPHDDHMHIRVFCSPDDVAAGCVDGPPLYPWRKRALAAAGVEPALAGDGDDETSRSPRKPKPKLKTIEQARAEAGPMHEDVIAFLDRRNAWVKKPHPGRRWCR
jgi:penicillin-insensitive murein DD-endopeptidase